MSLTTVHFSMSLDGFMAGPDQSIDEPLGVGGERLHEWHAWDGREMHPADEAMKAELLTKRGAVLMGRNMFGPIRGPWEGAAEGDWRGWWGDEPPYHTDVFVLTHFARDAVRMEGGTTFHFVTGGFAEGLRVAREAGDGDVHVAGGAATIRQALEAGEVDQVTLDIVPVTLGSGERVFPEGQVDLGWEPVEVFASPYATHVRYRVQR
jgi:dihydrofolate reductase